MEKVIERKNTIDTFLDEFDSKHLESFDVKASIPLIREIVDKIPVNGEYDQAIIGNRIGEYVRGMMECGKLLASLGLVEAYQATETEKIQAQAALEVATSKGYTTAAERKLYAQMDEEYIKSKNKLNEVSAVIAYIENMRSSLNNAYMHCKKIIDRNKIEEKFANEHERFGGNNKTLQWINEQDLKNE